VPKKAEGNFIETSFVIVLFVKYFLEQIKGNEMGVACGANGGREK
jgi:hypothetical protein